MKTILFDLDGTLLPMDLTYFSEVFYRELYRELSTLGYLDEEIAAGMGAAMPAMIANTGACTNREIFLSRFAEAVGDNRIYRDEAAICRYYATRFEVVASSCGYESRARVLLDALHREGVPAVLATNPMFPFEATSARLGWAGLSHEDFVYITSYDNSSYCKPNPDYFREILSRLSLSPEECLMVGNNVDEDMVAREAGISVFLVTDSLINLHEADLGQFPHGDFGEAITAVLDFIKA